MSLSPKSSVAAPTDEEHAGGQKDAGLVPFLIRLALIAFLLKTFVFGTFHIPSGSMIPTLYIGDYLAISKWSYGYSRHSIPFGLIPFEGRILARTPSRGDVVVFRHPVGGADLIKRVIGLPGDRIALEGGRLILNGKPVVRRSIGWFDMKVSPNSSCKLAGAASPTIAATATGEIACRFPAFEESLPGGPSYTVLDQVDQPPADYFPETTVPEGHVFVMGDNRDDSLDSRFQPAERGVGFLPMENITGKARFTYWSTDGSASYWKPWTWFTALRTDRIGNDYTGVPQ